jgi:uncharacterized protein (DUF2267 family)
MATDIDEFDQTIPATLDWIDDLQGRLGWHDRSMTYGAMKATLHALRDALPADEAVFLGGCLPTLLRGVYYEGWHLKSQPPPAAADQEVLFERIRGGVGGALGVDAEEVAARVLELLAARLPSEELEDVKAVTPAPLRFLWPA